MEIKDRISLIIKENRLTSQQFGEMIEIQPSSLSHISAGRNQPSLKVVMNILEKFPDISSDWLISGRGNMYRIDNNDDELDNEEESVILPKVVHEVIEEENTPIFTDVIEEKKETAVNVDFKPVLEGNPSFPTPSLHNENKEEIEANKVKTISSFDLPLMSKAKQIVVFYEDNTFEVFTSR